MYVRYPERGIAVILLSNVLVNDGDADWYVEIQDGIEAALFSPGVS